MCILCLNIYIYAYKKQKNNKKSLDLINIFKKSKTNVKIFFFI